MGCGRITTHRRARTNGPALIVDFAHVDTGRLFMAHALFVAGSAQAFLFVFFLVVSSLSLSLSLSCAIALAELSFATLGLGTTLPS